MLVYNLLQYSSNYSDKTGSLWFYSKNEALNFNTDIGNNNNFKSANYKGKLLGNTVADGNNRILKNVKIAAPLKYLSNFWRSLEMSLINCKVELKLRQTKYCALPAVGVDNADSNNNVNSNNNIFTIKGTKLHVPVVTDKRQMTTKNY